VADSSATNQAFDLDAQYGKPGDPGLFALMEYLQGTDATPAGARMRGFQVLAAYNVKRAGLPAWLSGIEPSVRLDLADPDTDAPDDRVTTLTAAFGLYFTSRAWFRVAYERQDLQAAGAESVGGIRSMLAVSF
jgi:hypothetical protein